MLTPFQKTLKTQIECEGPLPLSQVMEASNNHYYAQKKVFGAQGDFITSPEISQIFGEVIAFWALNYCLPKNINAPVIVELGPGRGVLARDMMRIFKSIKGFAPRFYFLENSSALRTVQDETLTHEPFEKQWIHDLSEIPDTDTLFIANEFFDALPIRQMMDETEVKVNVEADTFVFSPQHINQGKIIESSPQSIEIASQIASHLHKNGGAALLIDYGDYTEGNRYGDTLQAVLNHTYVKPLEHLGEADLTAHVDFKALADVFLTYNLRANFMTQGEFLLAYGFQEFLTKLLEKCASTIQKNDQESRAHRLIDPAQMGTLFKMMEITTALSLRP